MSTVRLGGVTEVAERVGLSRQRVHQLLQQGDFPAPDFTLNRGQVWRLDRVERWSKTRRKRPRGPRKRKAA